MGALDHGELNIPLAKRYGKGGIDAAIDRHLAEQRKANTIAAKAQQRTERERETTRVRLTHEQVKDATHIRDRYGWHKVVRVSAKTVTVETGHSWTDRIAIDKVLEAQTITDSGGTDG